MPDAREARLYSAGLRKIPEVWLLNRILDGPGKEHSTTSWTAHAPNVPRPWLDDVIPFRFRTPAEYSRAALALAEASMVRLLFAAGGWFFLGVGVVGMFLPLLPTTPFLLLSSVCFVRSSPRLHHWLMNHRHFGHYVRDWEEKRGVRPHVKVVAFTMMAAVVVLTTLFANMPAWVLGTLVGLVGIGGTVVWMLPTVVDEMPVERSSSTPGVARLTVLRSENRMNNALHLQPLAGLTPPAFAEARIRDAYPSVAANFAIATLGHRFTQSIFLAPVAWLIMAPAYFGKVLPFLARRYSLTNRRIMIRAGWKGDPIAQATLADVDDVKVVPDANSNFFRAANLEIVKDGKTILTLPGVPEPEAFRQAILVARDAWVPGKSKATPFISAGDYKG